MTTDITELAQSHELRNKVNHRLYGALEFQGTSGENATITLSIDECKSIIAALDERLTLVEALEKAQATEAHCNRGWREAHEQEARAEAAEKRIAELESRTVKLPKPHAHLIWIQAGHAPDDFWDDVAVSHSEKDRCCDGSERYPVYARWEIEEMLTAAGIEWEAE